VKKYVPLLCSTRWCVVLVMKRCRLGMLTSRAQLNCDRHASIKCCNKKMRDERCFLQKLGSCSWRVSRRLEGTAFTVSATQFFSVVGLSTLASFNGLLTILCLIFRVIIPQHAQLEIYALTLNYSGFAASDTAGFFAAFLDFAAPIMIDGSKSSSSVSSTLLDFLDSFLDLETFASGLSSCFVAAPA
jgi:hypothetical protein